MSDKRLPIPRVTVNVPSPFVFALFVLATFVIGVVLFLTGK